MKPHFVARTAIACACFATACAAPPASPNSSATAPALSSAATAAPAVTAAATAAATSTLAATEPPPVASPAAKLAAGWQVEEFDVPPNTRPHDVAPAPDGGVWFTAQGSGELGWLDPETGDVELIKLPPPSAPHGVIVGPDGAPWITDSGQNAIVRVDPATREVTVFALPDTARGANLNTAAFGPDGVLWFTGQTGFYGRVDPSTGQVDAWPAPRGRGPYGITATPSGEVYYASLAGSHIARIDPQSGQATVIDPPTAGQGARRAWSDSRGRIWVSEWNSGQVSAFDPADQTWRQWKLPGQNPRAYAVYVDDQDIVWLSDFDANAIVRFDPADEAFDVIPLPSENAAVRQILGRPGEVWGAASGASKLVMIRTAP